MQVIFPLFKKNVPSLPGNFDESAIRAVISERFVATLVPKPDVATCWEAWRHGRQPKMVRSDELQSFLIKSEDSLS
jgi:hypothetical protein